MSKALITASNSGNSTTGYTTRPLDTIQYSLTPGGVFDGFVSLAANQFTLVTGTYRISGRLKATGAAADSVASRLYNVTDAAVVSPTEDAQQVAILNENVDLFFVCAFTLAGAKVFRIEGKGSAAAVNGFGITPINSVALALASIEILKTA